MAVSEKRLGVSAGFFSAKGCARGCRLRTLTWTIGFAVAWTALHVVFASVLGFWPAEARAQTHGARAVFPRRVKQLLRDLRSEDTDISFAAKEALGRMGLRVVPILLDELEYARGEYEESLCDVLTDMGKAVVPTLIRALQTRSLGVALPVMRVLGHLKDPRAIRPIARFLSHRDAEVRANAVMALGFMRNRQLAPMIIGALNDPSAKVRMAAILLFSDLLPDRRAVSTLIGLLQYDSKAQVRHMAARALGIIGDPRAVPYLIGALSDQSPWVRSSAASALGLLKSRRAVPALIGASRDQDASVRQAAAAALGAIGDPRAIRALARLLGDEEKVSQAASEALIRFGSRALPAVIRALRDPQPRVRATAALTVGKIGGRRAVARLLAALRDTAWEVRAAAAQSLGELRARGAVSGLVARLRDPVAQVRRAAVIALGRIGDPRVRGQVAVALHDQDPTVREAAAKTLRALGARR